MTHATAMPFIDRRDPDRVLPNPETEERRQFSNSHDGLSPPAQELARAIDLYKLEHRRRFITYEEMYQVISSLGYTKP